MIPLLAALAFSTGGFNCAINAQTVACSKANYSGPVEVHCKRIVLGRKETAGIHFNMSDGFGSGKVKMDSPDRCWVSRK